MDWNTNTEQYLRQLSELQRGIFTSWASMMPNMPSANMPNTRDTVDNTLGCISLLQIYEKGLK